MVVEQQPADLILSHPQRLGASVTVVAVNYAPEHTTVTDEVVVLIVT